MTIGKQMWSMALAGLVAVGGIAATPGMAHASSRGLGTTFGWFGGAVTVFQDFGLGFAAVFGCIAGIRMMRGGQDAMEKGKEMLASIITGGAVLFAVLGIIAAISGRGAVL